MTGSMAHGSGETSSDTTLYVVAILPSHAYTQGLLTSGQRKGRSTTSCSSTPTTAPSSRGRPREAPARCRLSLPITSLGECCAIHLALASTYYDMRIIRKILGFVRFTLKWRLMDRKPLKTWIHPSHRVILLGDSCHPMLVSSFRRTHADRIQLTMPFPLFLCPLL